MKNLNIMLKPASALCNLKCKYCFYADVSAKRAVESCGIMSRETAEKIIENVFADMEGGDCVNFVFQGGEPTLAGLDFLRWFVERANMQKAQVSVKYALQTNGIILDDEWCAFLKEHKFLVGLSLDILQECHDSERIDAKGVGSYEKVIDAMRKLKRNQVDYNILCTLTNAVARHPKKVWQQILDLDAEYVQFTPCLGTLDGESSSVYALTPKQFASFYIQLFELWYDALEHGRYRSIKFFDDCVNLMMYGRPTSCGMNGTCRPQLVVEADGTAYPCDFYCLDEFRLGNLAESTPFELLKSEGVSAFLNRFYHAPKLCDGCKFQRFCGGNCKRMQKEICCSGDDEYCGYGEFLMQCGDALSGIARKYRR